MPHGSRRIGSSCRLSSIRRSEEHTSELQSRVDLVCRLSTLFPYTTLFRSVGKAVIVSVETETSEIIRRRLFEWDERAFTPDGRVMLTKEAEESCKAYATWVQTNRQQLPALINPEIGRAHV